MRISISASSSRSLLNNVEIQTNKRTRFTQMLHATAAGTLFERPQVRPAYRAFLIYHPPMWGVLQSSYEDVEAELNTLRQRHLGKKIMFVGGDGLTIMRINQLIRKYPDLHLDSTPVIIPVQGEAPHGVFHIMHAGWRLYRKFIRRAADETLGDQGGAIVDEPTVKVFNTQTFGLRWMTRACSEYLLALSRNPGAVDIDAVPEFIAASERNIDLAWVVHFLYDFAYLIFDMKQKVRANRSEEIDVLWREFLHTGVTGTANKNNYVPMVIMRLFGRQRWIQSSRT